LSGGSGVGELAADVVHVQFAGLLDEQLELRFGKSSRLPVDQDAVADDHQGRNRGDAVGGGQSGLGLGVDLPEEDVGVPVGCCIEYRGEGPAGSTPLSPEVDQRDALGVGELFEVPGGQFNSCHRRTPSEQAGEEATPLRLGGLDFGTGMAAIAPVGCGHGFPHGCDVLTAPGPGRLSTGVALRCSAHTLISLLGDTPGSISSCEYDTPGGIVVVNSTEGPPMTDTLVTGDPLVHDPEAKRKVVNRLKRAQ